VANREPCCHQAIVNPPLTGQSIPERGLDPPAQGAPRLESSVVLLDPAGHPFCITTVTPPDA
ncbi:MAG: hypothetical protein ACRDOE_11835, partial [Streptosporangiaceae bacterium]